MCALLEEFVADPMSLNTSEKVRYHAVRPKPAMNELQAVVSVIKGNIFAFQKTSRRVGLNSLA